MNQPRVITRAEREARQANPKWTGLGDVIASATKIIGIKPCSGCKRRQATLNRIFPIDMMVK